MDQKTLNAYSEKALEYSQDWLARNDYRVIGYDSSIELLKLARQQFPNIKFTQAFLPTLKEIQVQFDNILCETVIMHLPKNEISEGVQNLKRILKKGGTLYLSWRMTEDKDMRHKDGRLYSALDPKFILDHFPQSSILHFEDKVSVSSGKRVCRLIYRAE